MKNEILIANNLMNVPKSLVKEQNDIKLLGTIFSNLTYYGFIPSLECYDAINKLSDTELVNYWKDLEPSLKEITGANRNMDDFVVYKNFPKEVLDMSQSQYWISQILMYWGVPNEYFTEDKKDRPKLKEKTNLKVLHLANENSLEVIYNNLINNASRWSDNQTKYAKYLVSNVKTLNMDEFSFKENGITLISSVFSNKTHEIHISNATDVLRLASGLSEGDVSLRKNTPFKKFSRPERRFLVEKLENCNNLVEDFGLRKGQFKKLLAHLHPGDYKAPKVAIAYNELYQDNIKTFNSQIETALIAKDKEVLNLLKQRPGDFLRRFHKTYAIFNTEAITQFKTILPKLKTIQLVKLDKYVLSINDRKELMYPPKGNWTKAKNLPNKKLSFEAKDLAKISEALSQEIGIRLNNQFPDGINLDLATDAIKLQTNDQKLATYGRGTEFSIPLEMNFIRSASYWENKTDGNNWFDNGWNFFDKDWKGISACCWNANHNDGAVFSGDPTNSKDLKGRACQMIDLYLDKLAKNGIRYAVWNILSYSHVKFSDATEVLGTLQWGEKPEEGNLYEPSRAQMVFPIQGDNLTKYIAYIDIVERKLVYMDANLYGNVNSATSNIQILEEKMPAYIEYLNSLPSVADLFVHAKVGTIPVLYSDKDVPVEDKAYVFQLENPKNSFTKIDLSEVLNQVGVPIKNKLKMK